MQGLARGMRGGACGGLGGGVQDWPGPWLTSPPGPPERYRAWKVSAQHLALLLRSGKQLGPLLFFNFKVCV